MSVQDRLWEIAVEQYGYVTTRDARTVGASAIDLAKLAHRGQLSRAAHGVYRFDQLPVTARDEFMLAVLWTGSRDAALSHDTALAVYDLCDINPNMIHLAVPKGNRIRRSGGDYYVVHSDNLTTEQIGWWEGIRAVTVPTAIDQGIHSGIPSGLLEQAIRNARALGRVTDEQHSQLVRALGERA
ncbi:type IV toxin-antitoxin system AbiEi family antitoxin domain-containing protein [Cryobacterium frigoriphilum]|nr:type IV toxin-antitoxin system AbiEi family antitoxin domain-containing protein [Cryobacterium frigoriphilum]